MALKTDTIQSAERSLQNSEKMLSHFLKGMQQGHDNTIRALQVLQCNTKYQTKELAIFRTMEQAALAGELEDEDMNQISLMLAEVRKEAAEQIAIFLTPPSGEEEKKIAPEDVPTNQ